MRTWHALEVGCLEPILVTADVATTDLLQAALLDYKVVAIDESTHEAWRVFFTTENDRNAARDALARQFPNLSLRALDVPDENWVAKSQAHLRAVRVGNIIVAPPWDIPHTGRLKPLPTEEAGGSRLTRPVVIVIRPSMGFGTAHHATTRLCLAALQRIDVQGKSVLDVGTGSGVLAIAASRLGAAPVLGIDDDPNALHAARENLGLNRAAAVTLRQEDVRANSLPPVDLIIANVTGALLIDASTRLHELAAPGARLILSGFTLQEEAPVVAAYSDLRITSRAEEDEWLCVTLERRR
jgi:ribosomal protein L11 methyltransferase